MTFSIISGPPLGGRFRVTWLHPAVCSLSVRALPFTECVDTPLYRYSLTGGRQALRRLLVATRLLR